MTQHELITSHLHLHAVLQNLEDLVAYDPEMAALAKTWDVSIQFDVLNGPKCHIIFKNGQCRVRRDRMTGPSVRLFFLSPVHLNRMMDGKGSPIPLKGFTRLPFLTKDFPKLTDRLEFYLKPTAERLADDAYLLMNTRLTMNTAAFAVRELTALDPVAKLVAGHIRDGAVLLKVLPDGPAVHIKFERGYVIPAKGETAAPMACMFMRDLKTANAFLNGKLDIFSAIAADDISIRGQTPMLDALGLVLDRIPIYLK
jgi:hypothetical protein